MQRVTEKMRITEKMDMHTTRRARDAVGKRQIEIGDTEVPGLSIRVRKTSATWCLRGRLGPRQSVWTIGPVGGPNGIPLTEARKWSAKAKEMLKNGADPTTWLQEQVTGEPITRTFDPAKDGMTWEEGREAFLEWIKRERRPATHDDYRKTLRGQDCKRFAGRLLKAITDDDIRVMRDDIDKRAPAQAQHTLRVLKSCLSWLADAGGSGIKASPAAAVRPRPRAADEDDEDHLGRVPTEAEVGALAWHLAQATNPSGRLAGALLMLTSQRVRTVINARPQDFQAASDGGLWTIPRPFMKSRRGKRGRPHVVPLPPVAWHVVQQAIALAPGGAKWLFPQTRLRRATDAGDGCISRKLVADAMRADGGTVAPHDIRRAFGTYGESLIGWSTPETKMVLDHAEGRTGDVTRESYSLHDGTHVTWSIMRKWQAWVLERVAEQAPAGSPGACPAFLIVRRYDTALEKRIDAKLGLSTQEA